MYVYGSQEGIGKGYLAKHSFGNLYPPKLLTYVNTHTYMTYKVLWIPKCSKYYIKPNPRTSWTDISFWNGLTYLHLIHVEKLHAKMHLYTYLYFHPWPCTWQLKYDLEGHICTLQSLHPTPVTYIDLYVYSIHTHHRYCIIALLSESCLWNHWQQ